MGRGDRIILTGFMGTGKSAVGKRLAERLQFSFLDTDEMIESVEGKSIAEIFEGEGEASFREIEKKVIREALTRTSVVIATGGGAVTSPENLELFKKKGFLIALSASPEAILERVGNPSSRPLLRSKDPLKTIRDLLAQREPYYREAHKKVETTGRGVEETVEEILRVLK